MDKKPIRGNVSNADIMTSTRRTRPRAGREQYSLAFVVAELSTIAETLGHFPSRDEYRELGVGSCSAVVRMVGLRNLAKQLGMTAKTGGGRPKKRDPNTFECFNRVDCVESPPNRVDGKQKYCEPCKQSRGWYT
jgi:hypothetical protein